MTMLRLTRPALFLSAVLALAACEDGESLAFLTTPAADGDAAPAVSSSSTTIVERDVEAPEVFETTESGLWDGRPSLGGVWVAHPDVKEPERVLIRNATNDKFVIGALFRRERDNPGPRLQVSSDAADALGMLAGQPVRLNVTALRREEEKITVAPPAPAVVEAEEAPVIQPATPADAPTDTASVEADLGAAPAAAPKKGFLATLFGPKQPAEDAPQTADPAEAATEPLDAPPAVETRTLDAAAVPGPAPKPTPTPVSTLSRPFIQIGIFSQQTNADNAASSLRRDGILPTVLEQSGSGKTFWRVVVGPMTSETERTEILKKVKALGYADAYFVAR